MVLKRLIVFDVDSESEAVEMDLIIEGVNEQTDSPLRQETRSPSVRSALILADRLRRRRLNMRGYQKMSWLLQRKLVKTRTSAPRP